MDITAYKVKALQYPQEEYLLGSPVPIIDEGAFYRIDGTHIFDKFRIQSMECKDSGILLHMPEKDVLLIVE